MHSPLTALRLHSGALIDLAQDTYIQNQWRSVFTEIRAVVQIEVEASKWIGRRDQIGAESQYLVRSIQKLKQVSSRSIAIVRKRLVTPDDILRMCDDMAAASVACSHGCTRVARALTTAGGAVQAQPFVSTADRAQALAAHARALRVCSI